MIDLPQKNMNVGTEEDAEGVRRNVTYLADNAMPVRRETKGGAPKGGIEGDESWRMVDGKLFLYRRHKGRWYRTGMEEA